MWFARSHSTAWLLLADRRVRIDKSILYHFVGLLEMCFQQKHPGGRISALTILGVCSLVAFACLLSKEITWIYTFYDYCSREDLHAVVFEWSIYARTPQGHLATRARYQFRVQMQKMSQMSINWARFVVSCVDPWKLMDTNGMFFPNTILETSAKNVQRLYQIHPDSSILMHILVTIGFFLTISQFSAGFPWFLSSKVGCLPCGGSKDLRIYVASLHIIWTLNRNLEMYTVYSPETQCQKSW